MGQIANVERIRKTYEKKVKAEAGFYNPENLERLRIEQQKRDSHKRLLAVPTESNTNNMYFKYLQYFQYSKNRN